MRFRNYDNLRTFIVVARHLNMSRAAGELNLTKGAISYQVQQLEAALGFRVFSRARQQLVLTTQGVELLQVARLAIETVEREIDRIRDTDGGRITIGTATYFASRWLSPRLMHFITTHPRIRLRIQPLLNLTDLRSNDLDLAVRWGKGDWVGGDLYVEQIFPCPVMLTASAQIGKQIEAKGIHNVLKQRPLLHDHEGHGAWQDWYAAAGIEWSEGSDDLVIPDPNVRVQAVIDGQGLALYDDLIADEVMAERLYQYDAIALSEYGYYLVYPKEVANNPSIQIFRDWIMSDGVKSIYL